MPIIQLSIPLRHSLAMPRQETTPLRHIRGARRTFPGCVKGNLDRPGWVKIEEFSCLGGLKSQTSPICMVKIRKFAEPGGQVTLFDTACGRPCVTYFNDQNRPIYPSTSHISDLILTTVGVHPFTLASSSGLRFWFVHSHATPLSLRIFENKMHLYAMLAHTLPLCRFVLL